MVMEDRKVARLGREEETVVGREEERVVGAWFWWGGAGRGCRGRGGLVGGGGGLHRKGGLHVCPVGGGDEGGGGPPAPQFIVGAQEQGEGGLGLHGGRGGWREGWMDFHFH